MTVYADGPAPPKHPPKQKSRGEPADGEGPAVEPGAEADSSEAAAAAKAAAGRAGTQFKAAGSALAEIKDYALQWATATIGSYVVLARNLALLAALGAILAVAGLAAVATAAALAVIGLAQLIGGALHHRPWAGNLIIGVGLILLLVIGGYVVLLVITGASRRKSKALYQARLDRQRDAHGGWDAERRAEQTIEREAESD